MKTKRKQSVLERINEARNWLFEKSNRIDKSQASLVKKKSKTAQIINTRNEKQLYFFTKDIRVIMRGFCETIYAKNMKI